MRTRGSGIFEFILHFAALVSTLMLVRPAYPAVAGSKHDMWEQNKAKNKNAGICSVCHVPSYGMPLYTSPRGPYQVFGRTFSQTDTLCATCHLDNAIVDPNSFSQTMFRAGTHGLTYGTLAAGSRYAQGRTVEESPRSGLEPQSCTSCHNPHSNWVPPFLRYSEETPLVSLFAGLQELCEQCHAGRSRATASERKNPSGYSTHPSGKTARMSKATQGRAAVSFHSPDIYDSGWTLGPHLEYGSAYGAVVCGTCHVVHGLDLSSGGDTMPKEDLLMMDKASGGASLCLDCHESKRNGKVVSHWTPTSERNIPADEAAVAIAAALDLNAIAISPSKGYSGKNSLICLSCHDVHFGAPDTACLVDTTLGNDIGKICEACHPRTAVARGSYHAPSEHPVKPEEPCTSCHKAHELLE